ncbi:MAG: hypothetical protein ABWJ42_06480, partial [Sulfolobales archaeon]
MEAINRAMSRLGLKIGDHIRFKRRDQVIEGFVMPPYAFTDPDVIVVKLKNGYNVGVLADEIKDLEVLGEIEISRESKE